MPRMTRSRATKPPPTAAPKDTQLDMEDLVKCEVSTEVVATSAAPELPQETQHEAARHDFPPKELSETRADLLRWYDAQRRKLPWRGDPPPYLTTATHTNQKKTRTGNTGKMDTFLLPLQVKNEAVEEEEKTVGGEAETKVEMQRKVTPYETWVSEIMLQQTRVDTVVAYFLRWLDKFPTVEALAEASEEDVNALWAGLGYYRRARMLHAGAKFVVANFNGELPSTVEQLLTVPGIGPYTAGAIASIAFGSREPLVDGNVIRVVARLRAVGADPKNKQLIKFSWKAAGDLVRECERPGALNQALMELGATVCTVQNPECSQCPVKSVCLAYEEAMAPVKNRQHPLHDAASSTTTRCSICDDSRIEDWTATRTEVSKYPLKAKKNESKQEVICVAVVSSSCDKSDQSKSEDPQSDWQFLMAKRPDGGLLAGQWEFLHTKMSDGAQIPTFSKRQSFMDARLTRIVGKQALAGANKASRRDLGELTHIFSHVKHHMGMEHLHLATKPVSLPSDSEEELRWMTLKEMKQCGITTGVKKILALVLKPEDGKKRKVAKKRTPTQVTHDASVAGKRVKSIASFFKK